MISRPIADHITVLKTTCKYTKFIITGGGYDYSDKLKIIVGDKIFDAKITLLINDGLVLYCKIKYPNIEPFIAIGAIISNSDNTFSTATVSFANVVKKSKK